MIEPSLMNELIRQLKITRSQILEMDMCSEKRIRLDQFQKVCKDIDRAISICGDVQAGKYFWDRMNSHN